MLGVNVFASMDSPMVEYLADEAERRQVPITEVYQEEMAAKAELARITPRNADLLRIADRLPSQAWYEE